MECTDLGMNKIYAYADYFQAGDIVTTSALPGFSMDLKELFDTLD